MPFEIDANGNPLAAGSAEYPVTDAQWRAYADAQAASQWEHRGGGLPGGAASAQELANIIYQQNAPSGQAAQREIESRYNPPTLYGPGPRFNPIGQEAAMAQNRWLLTTPGYGIGVQTSRNRQGPIWPGTMSPGSTPQGNNRQNAIALSRGTPVPTQQAVRPADNRGGPGMSVAARQGLYPMTGSSRSAQPRPVTYAQPQRVTYVPPGMAANTNAYTNTPTQNGWEVAPPGVDADPSQGQFDSWTNQPLTMDDMTQAIYDAGY